MIDKLLMITVLIVFLITFGVFTKISIETFRETRDYFILITVLILETIGLSLFAFLIYLLVTGG